MAAADVASNGTVPANDNAGELVASIAQAQTISAGNTSTFRYCKLAYANHAEDEIALYDRQIRLWGVKAQEQFVTQVLFVSAFSV